ncbi:MAG: type I-U CRISPR-associated protein Csx17 [Phycisphaeraceae bacterium]|nr:type I-U CRISPR-associated protein Csx17 [Phycisphaeraceae bacterium]
MPEAMHEVVLPGCTPEPLMNYLKALGILRLVAEDCEHGDPDARGFWRDDQFVLRSRLDKKALEVFFLEHYRPTPIVAPWAGGSGFFERDNKEAVRALSQSSSARAAGYRDAIGLVQQIIGDERVVEKPRDEDKVRLIQRYRRELPDEVVSWMDAAMVLQQDGQSFAPILGTGGNDGRLDFTQNFMQRIVLLGLHGSEQSQQSSHWFALAAFALPTKLHSASIGQFAPGRAGGPNATQGMEGSSTDNPWEFVLMLEGSLVLAGAAVRRLGTGGDTKAVFPFTVRAADVGFTSAGRDESAASRGELWMPLWERPSSLAEITMLFGEGRAEVCGRPVRDAVTFARAAATLGVDRGITVFARTSLLKRSGKAFLATPAGRIVVREQRNADLLREIDPWLDSFRSACSGDNMPARFTAALRGIDAAIFDFCRYGGANHFADILIALGRAEREMALTPGKIGQSKTKVTPLAGLSFAWVRAAAGTGGGPESAPIGTAELDHEFQIALSLAGLRAAEAEESRVGPLRTNLEPVSTWYNRGGQRTGAKWAEKDRAVVWNAADLAANLSGVLARRVMDGGRHGCENLPLAPARDSLAASPAAIAAFLRGDLNDQRIMDLLWGLMLADPPHNHGFHRQGSPGREAGASLAEQLSALPPLYCLLKLLFLPRDLVVSQSRGRTFWHLTPHGTRGTHRIRPEPVILALLRSGRVGEAAAIAMRRLRASGLTPLPHRRSGRPSRDAVWREVRLTPRQGQRLAAALLIPIDPTAINEMVRSITRCDDFEEMTPPPYGSDVHDHPPAAAAASISTMET